MRQRTDTFMVMRFGRPLAALGCVVALHCIAAGAHAQQMPLDQAREAEKSALLERHRALIAPQPLPAETFLAWAADVHLDDATGQAFADLVEGYRLRLPPLEKDIRSKIADLYPASFAFDRDAREVVAVHSPQLIELYDLHERLVDRILDLERPVVAALAGPLDAAGQGRIESAWLSRLRRLRGLTPPAPPINTLDPIELIGRLALEELDRNQIDPVIAQYRRDLIALLEGDAAESPVEVEARRARMELELGPQWQLFFEPAEVEEMTERMAGSSRPRMFDQAAGLTSKLISDVAAVLPPRQSIELRSLYFQHILPDFFDEEREMLALADTIAAILQGIEGEEAVVAREALDRGLAAAAQELDITAQAATELSVRASEASGRRSAAEASDRAAMARSAAADLAIERDLLEVRRERRRIIGRALDSIQVAAQHSPDYAALREMFEQFRRVQRWREEADEFRQQALAERIEGLETLAREREGR